MDRLPLGESQILSKNPGAWTEFADFCIFTCHSEHFHIIGINTLATDTIRYRELQLFGNREKIGAAPLVCPDRSMFVRSVSGMCYDDFALVIRGSTAALWWSARNGYTDNGMVWISKPFRVEYILARKGWAKPKLFGSGISGP